MKKKKVAIIGTNGIPAQYGGFETLVEYLTKYLSNQFDITVYCSKSQKKKIDRYNNTKLIYIPLRANGWQSLFYDIFSLFHASCNSELILYLGPAVGFILPFVKFLFKKDVIVNHGGLNEWERSKYSNLQKFISRLNHKYAALYANINIADNTILQKSIYSLFGVNSVVIRYGGDHAVKVILSSEMIKKYSFLREEYYISVSRAQIDNNLHIVLEAFAYLPDRKLVMVSNWDVSLYGINLKKKYYNKYQNIILIDAIYDTAEINAIRGFAKVYIHSHSYCGTSPSLVEAMYLGLPVFSYDTLTNRETTKGKALFFSSSEELRELILSNKNNLIECGRYMKEVADYEYQWSYISSQYAELFLK
jgi:glycosyltransferase involved in cell wall biosynthesis